MKKYVNLKALFIGCLCIFGIEIATIFNFGGMVEVKIPPQYIIMEVVFRKTATNMTNNTLSEYRKVYAGRWKRHKTIDMERMKYIAKLTADFRRRLNVVVDRPVREDLKCGLRYPAGSKNLISTQCDPKGVKPCCNELTSLCGNTTEDCDCEPVICKDYSKEVQAEFADWEELYSPIKNYNTDSTCDFLTRHFSSMTFAGDSQTRHIYQSSLIHLTGDPLYGTIKNGFSEAKRQSFRDEAQFYTMYYPDIAQWNDLKDRPSYCKNTKKKVRLEFLQLPKWSHLNTYIQNFKEKLKEGKPLFIFGIGLWDNFDWENISKKFMVPIFEFLNSYNDKPNKPVVIWLGVNAHGSWKQNKYVKMQGDYLAVPFNVKAEKLCEKYNIPFFDNFNFTFNTVSQDGTHYGSGVNNVKFKMLMKLAKYLVNKETQKTGS